MPGKELLVALRATLVTLVLTGIAYPLVTTGAALQRAGTGEFGTTAVGSATTRTATVTASRAVTVTGVSSSAITSPDPFTLGQVTETVALEGEQHRR